METARINTALGFLFFLARWGFMAGLAIGLALIAAAQVTIPYITDFDSSLGFTPGSLDGQQGWLVLQGTADVTGTGAILGDQCVVLNPDSNTVSEIGIPFAPFTFVPPAPPVMWIDCVLQPVASSASNITSYIYLDTSLAILVTTDGSTGQVYTFDGSNWVTSPNSTFYINSNGSDMAWMWLTFRLDFSAKKWDLDMYGPDGMPLILKGDQPFLDDSITYLPFFVFQGDASAPSYLNLVQAGPTTLLFTDVNNDGIPDAWEIAHGFDPSVPGSNYRYADPTGKFYPATGEIKTILDDYIDGTDPNDYYSGVLPTLASLVDLSGKPGAQGLVSIKVTTASGVNLANAPVTLSVAGSSAQIAATPGGALSNSVTVKADANGVASAYITFTTLASDTLTAAVQAVAQNGSAISTSISVNLTAVPAAPTFNPAANIYSSAQAVTITSATAGVTIRYTVDGSTPTETNGTVYSGPVNIIGPTELKAMAYGSGSADSSITGGLYEIVGSSAPVLNVLFNFAATNSGGTNPLSALVQGSGGNFYGTTDSGGASGQGTVFMMTPGGAVTTLVSFDGTNGSNPDPALVLGSDGNFYGTTDGGGANGYGTVFMMTPAGVVTTLVSFNGANGAYPNGLILGNDGNFYGTTEGDNSDNNGTAFMMTPAGVLTTLASFNGANGTEPLAALVQGSDGNFYGTTDSGGSAGDGTVFKVTSNGVLTTLVSFNGTNGSYPDPALVLGSDGNFYGTTVTGGANDNGTVFMMTPAGVVTTLVSFNGVNGASPNGLMLASDGTFYGTTTGGGAGGDGTVFSVTATGTLTALASFNGATGANPSSPLMQGSDGNLYGTTCNGGSLNAGVVFQLFIPPVPPLFSPAPGTYSAPLAVSITDQTGGATIYYTTDGTTPTLSSTVYTGSISLPLGVTQMQAIAVGSNGSSALAGGVYTVHLPPAAAPVFTPAGGSYTSAQTVTITSTTGGATIRYTTDGSSPSESNGTLYTGPVSLASTTNLQAIAYESGLADSNVTNAIYIINLPPTIAPIFSLPAGTYASAQTVAITSPTSGASIVYTVDGSPPIESGGSVVNGTLLSNGASVPIGASSTLQAIAFENGMADSDISSASYTINLQSAAVPVFSPSAGTYATAQTVAITSATSGATIRYTTDGSTPTETNGTIYSGPVNLGNTTVLKAIAYANGFADSPAAEGLYTITGSPTADIFNVMFDFAAANNGGINPSAALVQGTDGNFYGTAAGGGSAGDGTVFMMTPSGTVTTLLSFNGANGAQPDAALIQGSDGNFYGTTVSGGIVGDGTVFMMTPSGTITTLVSFDGANGAQPNGLVQGNDGDFYGTTQAGGSGSQGTVFKLTPAGVMTTLLSFNGANGSYPAAALVQGSDGNFYGTTQEGGSGTQGTVFLITPDGVLTTLVSFAGANGASPAAMLVQGSDGNLYGTTQEGGSGNAGTIFEMTPTGVLTTLTSFAGANGSYPNGLAQGGDGNFYGTTSGGGSGQQGTVFSITPAGILTTLVSFTGANGIGPQAAVMQGGDGNIYGTTSGGGSANNGVVFQIIAHLPPVAPSFSPTSGTYAAPLTVTISAASGETIYYTTNGSTPTSSSTVYTGPIPLAVGTTQVQAIASNGNGMSLPASATYTVNPLTPPAAPSFSPAPGTYTTPQTVSITGGANTSAIYYTTDGNTPTNSSALYSGPIPISTSATLQAIAVNSAGSSPAASGIYTVNLPQVTAPVFSLAAGAYSDTQSVKITTATVGATIRYTTDGSTPSLTNGAIYTGNPLTISGTTTLEAIALELGMADSTVTSATYTLQAAPPVFSVAAGTYSNVISVTITSSTAGAIIRYTTDGSVPTETNGAHYSGSVNISSTATLQAIAYRSGVTDSSVTSAAYTVNLAQVTAPRFTPGAGTYVSAQTVTITTAVDGASIRYTTDGSTPTETNGLLYSGPINLNSNTTLSAIAFMGGVADSSVTSKTYTFLPTVAAPVLSPAAGTYSDGQTVTITSSTSGASIRYTVDGSTPTETNGTLYSGPINIAGTTALNAIAYESGSYADSAVVSGIYTVTNGLPSLPYSADFETNSGYTLGSINGQLGWIVKQGSALVTDQDHASGSQSVLLQPGAQPAQITQAFAPLAGQSILFVDFYAKPVAESDIGAATTFDLGCARFAFALNDGGQGVLQAFNGDGSGGGSWQSTSLTAPLLAGNEAQNWIHLTARLDFAHQTWDLYAGGNMVAADLGFLDDTVTYLSTFVVTGDAATASGFDDLLISTTNPLFADVNNDGIDDAWESSHGLGLSANDRDLDPTISGQSVIQDYVNGTDPNDYYGGALPVLTSLVASSGVPGPQGLVSVLVTRASDGSGLVNAPVTLAVTSGASRIFTAVGGTGSTQVTVLTNSTGVAQAYLGFVSAASDTLVATAHSGTQTVSLSINVQPGGASGSGGSNGSQGSGSLPGPQGSLVSVQLRGTNGSPLANSSVTLSVAAGESQISSTATGSYSGQATVQTDANGNAQLYVNFASNSPLTLSSGGSSSTTVYPPITNSMYVFVDLGANVEPIAIASNGLITLGSYAQQEPAVYLPYQNLSRWRAGIVSSLYPLSSSVFSYYPPPANSWNSLVDPSALFLLGGLGDFYINKNGWISSNASDYYELNTQPYTNFSESFGVVWPDSSDIPFAIKGPVYSWPNLDNPAQINTDSGAGIFGLDNNNGIWTTISVAPNNDIQDNGLHASYQLYSNSTNHVDLFNGRYGDAYYNNQPSFGVADVNAQHSAVGGYFDPSGQQFTYIGNPATPASFNFIPLGLNDAGQALGDDVPYGQGGDDRLISLKADIYGANVIQRYYGYSAVAPFVLAGNNRQYLQGVQNANAIRISGFDEAGDVYGSINPDYINNDDLSSPGQQCIWVANPTDWGLPANTPPYTPIPWQMPTLPTGYTSLYGVQPGMRRIELGVATAPDGNNHGFALIPAGMEVDTNRDGEIHFASQDTSDQTSADQPFRFWINDGVDGPSPAPGESNVQDSLVSGIPNCQQGKITCTRDLENFARLWISIGGLSQDIVNGNITVGLEWQPNDSTQGWGSNGNAPAINLYLAAPKHGDSTPTGGTDYLTDPDTAKDQASEANYVSMALGVVARDTPFYFDKSVFSNLTDTNKNTYFLFEGASRGTGRLVLTFNTGSPGNYTKIGEGAPVYMDLRNIKELYERWTVGDGPTPGLSTGGGGPPDFPAGISTARLPSGVSGLAYSSGDPGLSLPGDPNQNKYILFVHGWNLPPWEKDAFAETALKRLYWQGYKGRFGTFEWPTTYSNSQYEWFNDLQRITSYDYSEYSAWLSAAPLEQLLQTLNGAYPGNVYLLAHSQGNVVAGEALRIAGQIGAGQLVNTYIATQAAVPAHCYDPSLPDDLFSSLNTVTPNIYKNWLVPPNQSAGTRANFYNVNDYAMFLWRIDQSLKPDINADNGNSYFYWGFNYSPVDDFYRGLTQLHLGTASNVQDRYEIMAFASQPWSYPLCMKAKVVGFAPQNLPGIWPKDTFAQLRGPYSAHPWHSAEFRFTNADQFKYWNALLQTFKLKSPQ